MEDETARLDGITAGRGDHTTDASTKETVS
jgi:hypothetical protein